MAQSCSGNPKRVASHARSRDNGKLVLYAIVLLLLLLGGDILRRVLSVVRPTTVAVAAARRGESTPVHRQTTRVRRQNASQDVAPRRSEPTDHFLAEIAARKPASTSPSNRSTDPKPAETAPVDASALALLAQSGGLRDWAAQQYLLLSHPAEGPQQLTTEQRPSSAQLDMLRREGVVIR